MHSYLVSTSLKCTTLKQFTASLRAVASASKKPFAEIVNKALKDVAFRAMQFTEYADPGDIRAGLTKDNIALKIAARRVSARAGQQMTDRYGNAKLTKSGRARVHKTATQSAIRKEAASIIKKRMASSRAMRAGWIPAIKALGGSPRGEKLKQGGSASKGYASKANPSKLSGLIANALVTRSADSGRKTPVEMLSQAKDGLAKAVSYVTADRNNHARKKETEKLLKQHSDR